MRGKLTLLAGVCAGAIAIPAYAQEAQDAAADDTTEIIVTAQRTNQRLQEVPIAVTAFSAAALEQQQIKNTSDLQLSLPNVSFTKTNFTSSSFSIRGIGDLCVGVACDQATAIHMNDAPLLDTRLFEGEFYDLAQIEVLRGPQGTLFGRNATSGVVNIRTARPRLGEFGAGAELEYANYDSVKAKGFVNVPVGETVGVRVAGFYLNRDGYTKNVFDGKRYDDRNMYGLRGSLRFEPSSTTTIDLVAQYFHEKDQRMRIQKQMCQRDPTGILGCLNGRRDYQVTNSNATIASIGTSNQFFAVRGLPAAFALGSLYAPTHTPSNPVYSTTEAYNWAGATNPADPRVVNTDTPPSYYAKEWIVQGSLEQELGGGLNLKVSGNYQDVVVDSAQDYNLSVQNRAGFAPALGALQAAGAGLIPLGAAPASLVQTYFRPVSQALIPGGAAGVLCTSLAEPTGTGVFGGHKSCAMTPQDYDRSVQYQTSWSAEGILSSDWDGPFNFLLGGIYGKRHMTENSYYVNAFSLDYYAGVVGAFASLSGAAGGVPPSFFASPFYRNNSDDLKVRYYGLFGEAYYEVSDKLKLTLGLRYNNDQKRISARTTLWFDNNGAATPNPVLVPHGSDSITDARGYTGIDFDPYTAGVQEYARGAVNFDELTGRAVLDYKITDDNLVYLSYSRGYKSGGINPPLSPVTLVSPTFEPEFIDAFEIGSKNQFGNVTLNLTAFYYKYKALQLSRIVSRTSVNDNVDAEIYGLEGEMVARPAPGLTVNLTASYLNAKVSQDKFLANPRDFGGGRADAVIIKDVTNASNCAVASTSGNVAGVNTFVGRVNGLINAGVVPGVPAGNNLQTATTAFGADSGIASRGAFGLCSALAAAAGGAFNNPLLGPAAIDPAALGGIQYYSAGVPVNIKGNKLPGAPDYKLSAGVQYEAPIGSLTLTPRADFVYTGKSVGNIFGGAVNEIPAYSQVNAQLQLDGPDRKWFVRAFVQNLFDKDSITGLYVTDQNAGLFTNVFTLEPRRYGVSAGVKF